MRLIDADVLMQMLRHDIDCYNTGKPDNQIYINAIDVENMINGQPTAYGVDKVVKRLEEMRDSTKRNIALNSQEDDIEEEISRETRHYQSIIQIVKSGGIE